VEDGRNLFLSTFTNKISPEIIYDPCICMMSAYVHRIISLFFLLTTLPYPLPRSAPDDDDAHQTSYLITIGCVVLEVLLVGEVKKEVKKEEEEEKRRHIRDDGDEDDESIIDVTHSSFVLGNMSSFDQNRFIESITIIFCLSRRSKKNVCS
jgi:hypothetical protein